LRCRSPLLSADNRCLPVSEFHFTIPVAAQAIEDFGADRLIVSRQSPSARGRIPFHDTCSRSGQRALRRRSPLLSADNRCLPGSEFHFTIPVVVQAIEDFCADRLVVSRQLMLARGIIPFHDTCSRSGQRALRCRSPVVSRQSLPAMCRNSISRYL
jgi:hypothetical protein